MAGNAGGLSEPDGIDRWIGRVIARHTSTLRSPEFLKAVRALSARYVQGRDALPGRSAIDSAGKRAAFGGFFAPVHFVTMQQLLRALEVHRPNVARVVDAGCGTGVASAAWLLHHGTTPAVIGIDRDAWALDEAHWNWRALGLRGKTSRADLPRAVGDAAAGDRASLETTVFLFAWSINELDSAARHTLLTHVRTLAERRGKILVIEPLARSATPWWNDWVAGLRPFNVRADDWKLPLALPRSLAGLSEAAGFRKETLNARTLWIG